MFPTLRHRTATLALDVCLVLLAHISPPRPGDSVNTQARHTATFLLGYMTGTPTKVLSADYIHQQSQQMGCRSGTRTLNSRYIYTTRDNRKSWHNATRGTVIVAHESKAPQQIAIMTHLDAYASLSGADADVNLGGLTLQGMDDNVVSLGVVLELAKRLKDMPTEYSIRFVAASDEEEGRLDTENLLRRTGDTEKKNTLLVISLDSLIVDDKLCFNNGANTPETARKLTHDQALATAHSHGTAATANPSLNKDYPRDTGYCNNAEIFSRTSIAVLPVKAANWNLGSKDDYQQRIRTATSPAGNDWHDVRLNNQQHTDKALPRRIERHCRDTMRIMLPLVEELAGASQWV